MQNCLYFICPTDHLEAVIDCTFRHRSYYYTSLGNSVIFDGNTIRQLKSLIRKNNIGEVAFVLSHDNRIVLDALGGQDFSEIRGLNNFYNEIKRQKRYSEESWQICNRQFSILSYYLNKKIKELHAELDRLFADQINISGKIYNKQEHVFADIYSDLICRKRLSLN